MSERSVKFIDEVKGLKESFIRHVHFTVVKDRHTATIRDYYNALSATVWDQLCQRWLRTKDTYEVENPKMVYFLSMEYNVGRTLSNTMINAGIETAIDEVMYQLGMDIEDLESVEIDAGLGYGGLGRLAACFLDSLATRGIASVGYGIRYESGAFHQRIVDGWQIEDSDEWLLYGNPWEKERSEETQTVKFFGRFREEEEQSSSSSSPPTVVMDTDDVIAVPYDTPIPGFNRTTCNTLRLWTAKAPCNFDWKTFYDGDYIKSVLNRCNAENISRVLYPIDHVYAGKELRLKQEYFLASASIRDILQRFKRSSPKQCDLFELAYKAAIHLNDTHPALAIPELMRILTDEEAFEWTDAWTVSHQTFTHTNHVARIEALKFWPVSMLEATLPRVMQMIRRINQEFLLLVDRRWPGDTDRAQRMSILQGPPTDQSVSMDRLCFVGCHRVNGVSRVQTEHLKTVLFKDLTELWPDKLVSKTNGISPRRWLMVCNKGLADALAEALSPPHAPIDFGWVSHLSELSRLKTLVDNPRLQANVMRVKKENKQCLADYIYNATGLELDLNSMFDVMVKRVDDYKRHLLFCLFLMTLYNRIKAWQMSDDDEDDDEDEECLPMQCPRTVIVGGLSSPGNMTCKLTIKLLNCVARKINADPLVRRFLTVIFVPNYRVSVAERVIPAADLSEQIPCVGTEASGTSNMKFMLNGALTIGTRDGANIEVFEEAGPENAFIFGRTFDEVQTLRAESYDPKRFIAANPELKKCLDQLVENYFNPGQPGLFNMLHSMLTVEDRFLVCADYHDYLRAQSEAERVYADQSIWARMVLHNLAGAGRFSSDRVVDEYAADIWSVSETKVVSDRVPVITPKSPKFFVGL